YTCAMRIEDVHLRTVPMDRWTIIAWRLPDTVDRPASWKHVADAPITYHTARRLERSGMLVTGQIYSKIGSNVVRKVRPHSEGRGQSWRVGLTRRLPPSQQGQ